MFLYKVSIDYKDFTFTNPMHACSFAERAARYQVDNYEVKIAITYEPDELKNKGGYSAAHLNDETEN